RRMLAGRSLDHLIRPRQQRGRDGEPERLRGLEVDDQLELRGLLDGKVCRLGAFEDPIYIGGTSFAALPDIRSVEEEHACASSVWLSGQARQSIFDGEVGNVGHDAEEEGTLGRHDRLSAASDGCREDARQILSSCNLHDLWSDT